VKQVMATTPGPGSQRQQLLLRLAGAALLAATGGIHLDLYLTGYRHIPTIGWLFLLQVIAAFALAAAFRAAVRAHPASYCGRRPPAVRTAAARRAPARWLAAGD
jgi:hypothetical protein